MNVNNSVLLYLVESNGDSVWKYKHIVCVKFFTAAGKLQGKTDVKETNIFVG